MFNVISDIVDSKFEDCKIYAIDKIESENNLNDNQRREIDKIFIDINEDRDTLKKRLENIIDEFQYKKGFYNK